MPAGVAGEGRGSTELTALLFPAIRFCSSARRVHHVGAFPTLEDQMCGFAADFDRASAGFSPDRVDGLVWALTDLLVEPMPSEGHFEYMRQRAAAFWLMPRQGRRCGSSGFADGLRRAREPPFDDVALQAPWRLLSGR
jgi:hypothetical protein